MSATLESPRWDMTVVYPSLSSTEFRTAFEAIQVKLASLEAVYERYNVRANTAKTVEVEALETVLNETNHFSEEFNTVRAYIYSFVSTDAKDETAQAFLSQLEGLNSRLSKLWTRLSAWCGGMELPTVLPQSEVARQHEYFLRRCATLAQRQMTPAEEDLASDLGEYGSRAWSRLHGDVTSQLMVRVQGEEVPMAVVRGMAYDADRSVRQAAYEAELSRWETVETPLAAAMNAIKGEVGRLASRRGWGTPLHNAVFEANMDMATLEAMMGAAKDAFPAFRRYLKAKAKLVANQSALDWFDLFASVGQESTEWAYPAGADFVAKQFHSYSEKMGSFAERSYQENWIDALARPGKRDGAFCMGLRGDESRILMSWKPSFGSVSTLAHELGHAYHNLCLASKTDIQSDTPMTLAETASIFCEQIISQAALKSATGDEKLAILEQSIQRATQTVVDISSRYLFEKEVFEKRADRALSAREFSDLMLWAQSETYGDGLSELRHGYMWAVKPHYYSGGSSFYNFPYMFGLLFSLGLYAIFERDPDWFRANYDDLLASTGLADAATLAQRFEIDITTSQFWEASLQTVVSDIDTFVEMVG